MLLYHGDFIKKRADLGEKEKESRGFVRGNATQRGKEKVTGERWKGETEGVKTEENGEKSCVSPGQIRLGDVIKIGKMCLMNIHLCLDLRY